MALGQPFNIRLSVEKQFLYEAEAESRNKSLGTYLRERLEADDIVLTELTRLHHVWEKGHPDTPVSPTSENLWLEILLLLRSLASPAQLNMIQLELKRLGFSVWRSEKETDHGT